MSVEPRRLELGESSSLFVAEKKPVAPGMRNCEIKAWRVGARSGMRDSDRSRARPQWPT